MARTEKVSELRVALKKRTDRISDEPGVYRWWFREDAVAGLLKPLPPVSWQKLQKRLIGDQTYLALYFGIASHLRQRLDWHINQKHNPSAVRSGFLSTLRQTLGALLLTPASESEDIVNDFIDSNCCLEFHNTPSREDAGNIERDEITCRYYPLNVQGNKSVERDVVKALSSLRKQYKKQ